MRISESRCQISATLNELSYAHSCDGYTIMYDRFAKKMGDLFIRGAVLRTCIYAKGEAADYVAANCLKTIWGDGLYGKGDITPVCCALV